MGSEGAHGKTAGADAGTAAVHGHRLSTVVPASVTGADVTHALDNWDLLFKLHYLRGVYYFAPSEVVQGLSTKVLKDPMFAWLDAHITIAGRIRRTEAGRPYVKCNDSGVRIVEARCDKTLAEWLQGGATDRVRHLTYDRALGPELYYSPPVYVQFTNFKCGGLAIGLSWAHFIGDFVSAAASFNTWAQILSNKHRPFNANPDLAPRIKAPERPCGGPPHSVKLLASPVQDYWIAPTSCRMASYSFHITEAQLKNLQPQEFVGFFELICALLWHALAKMRAPKEMGTVTVCRTDMAARSGRAMSNEQKIGYVTAASPPAKADVAELATLIAGELRDETELVAALVDAETGNGDAIVYGANLTFVDVQEVEFYGLEIRGQRPVLVEYGIDGVGEEGAVLVQPDAGEGGRLVTAVLPDGEVDTLRAALGNAWGIA